MSADSPSQPPSKFAARPVRILSVPPGVPCSVRFLAGFQGLLTHWKGKGSIPCPGVGTCPDAIHRLRTIWKGYAPVLLWEVRENLWRPWVLEITENLEEQLRGRKLRGEEWLLTRLEIRGRTDPVSGVLCRLVDSVELPEAFDVLPVLQKVLGSMEIRLGVANPTPAKVVLSPIAGDAPTIPTALQPVDVDQVDKSKLPRMREEVEKAFRLKPSNNGSHASNGTSPANG